MKKPIFHHTLASMTLLVNLVSSIVAQPAKPPVVRKGKPIVFAVINNGTMLEPIAYLNNGKLEPTVDGGDDIGLIAAFGNAYYKKGTVYKLIFGGAAAGTVSVKSFDSKADCGKNLGTVTTKTTKTPLKGMVMSLATNAPITATVNSRRKPTPTEKDAADALARAEFLKLKLTPKVLRFQNLTAIDVDNDRNAELIGSYWVEIDKLTRGLLFFIAGKNTGGKYSIGHQEYRLVDQASIMGGAEIKSIDDGVLHELLLDAFDVDGDGTAEIFTHQASFEGAGFNAYRRSGTKWTRVFEGSNYRCAF